MKPVRLWYQLLASEAEMGNNIAATQAVVDKAASPGTTVEVHGTKNGALGNNYRVFGHYDTREVIANGLKVRQSGEYDAFVIANSLDPGLVELREILDIPVTSFMEVSCFTACMMGERFGILVSNDKFVSRYREIVIGYGLRERLASVEALKFDNMRDYNNVFDTAKSADRLMNEMFDAGRRAIAQGAEVLIAAGAKTAFLAGKGIHELDGVPLLDCYSLLVKVTEALVAMHRITGVCVSRKRLYQSPPKDIIMRAAELHGIEELKKG